MKKFFANFKALFTKGEKTTLQKQLRLITIFIALAIVGLIVFFAIIKPATAKKDNTPIPLEGEYVYGSNLLVVPYTTRQEMDSIEISNSYGTYKLISKVLDSGEKTFFIEGNEGIVLDSQALSKVVVGSGIVYASTIGSSLRVSEDASLESIKSYGLTEDNENLTTFKVKRTDGTEYKILIGDSIPSGNAYYMMVEGRENVVYAMSSTVAFCFTSRSTSLVYAQIAKSFNTVTEVKDFRLYRNNNLIIEFKSNQDVDSSTGYELIYPKAYYLNEDKFGSDVLNVLYNITVAEIVEYGENTLVKENYEKYGLDLDPDKMAEGTDKNHAILFYDFAYQDKGSEEEQICSTMLVISEKQLDENGAYYYYVYSDEYSLIGKVSASFFGFVDWGIASFTSDRMFYDYLTACDYFKLTNYQTSSIVKYNISGKERSYHVDVLDGNDNKILDSNGLPRVFDAKYEKQTYGGKFVGEFENFRELYLVLITRLFDLTADTSNREFATSPAYSVEVATTPRDNSKTFGVYDGNGNKVKDPNTGSQLTIRYEGGYIICKNVVAKNKADGTAIEYGTVYYDLSNGRFFQKKIDSNDGENKPVNISYNKDGIVTISQYLPKSYEIVGEYEESINSYDFYYIYETYTDAEGKVQKIINQTEMYCVPSIIKTKYIVSSENGIIKGESEKVVAESGMIMRKTSIDKLFEDSEKVLSGIEIDAYSSN